MNTTEPNPYLNKRTDAGDEVPEAFEAKAERVGVKVDDDGAEGLRSILSRIDDQKRADSLEQTVADLRRRHPGIELWWMPCGDQDVLFTSPGEHEFAECIGTSVDKKKKTADALRRLAFQVVKHPDAKALRAIFEKRPGFAVKLGNDALAAASDEDPDFAKKV